MISGDEALDDIQRFLHYGLASAPWYARLLGSVASEGQEKYAAVRAHAVKAIAHCSSQRALQLLREASNDPDPDVRAHANEIAKRVQQ